MKQQELISAFSEIARARRSVRGFLAEPIPRDVLNEIFELAQTAPSNCNVQPWAVHVASADLCKDLKARLVAGARSDRLHMAWIPLVVRMQFSS